MPVKYICKSPGCRNLVEKRGYCSIHAYKQRLDDERKLQWFNNKEKYRNEWTELYNSARWKKERKQFLVENPRCVCCGAEATVVDHVEAHRGDEELFWRRENWQSLCTECHNHKTLMEMSGRRKSK